MGVLKRAWRPCLHFDTVCYLVYSSLLNRKKKIQKYQKLRKRHSIKIHRFWSSDWDGEN